MCLWYRQQKPALSKPRHISIVKIKTHLYNLAYNILALEYSLYALALNIDRARAVLSLLQLQQLFWFVSGSGPHQWEQKFGMERLTRQRTIERRSGWKHVSCSVHLSSCGAIKKGSKELPRARERTPTGTNG